VNGLFVLERYNMTTKALGPQADELHFVSRPAKRFLLLTLSKNRSLLQAA
jgi:hypothetical protein